VSLCPASNGLLATGDERGTLAIWDLKSSSKALTVKLHDGIVRGIQHDTAKRWLFSTATDSYIVGFDLEEEVLVERVVPAAASCGSGVPNTTMALSDDRRGLLLVGGTDGRIRLWTRDDTALRRSGLLSCRGAQPTKVLFAPDGWTVAASTVPADPWRCGCPVERGGLTLFDLRRLSDGQDAEGKAVVATFRDESEEGVHCLPGSALRDTPLPPGGVDLALGPGPAGQTVAFCLMGGLVRVFGLGGQLPTEELSSEEQTASDAGQQYDQDVISDLEERDVLPSAIGTSGRFVFVATTAPSLCIWRQTHEDDSMGHGDYPLPRPSKQLALAARCGPHPPDEPLLGATPGSVLAQVQAALEEDRRRLEWSEPIRGCEHGVLELARDIYKPWRAQGPSAGTAEMPWRD